MREQRHASVGGLEAALLDVARVADAEIRRRADAVGAATVTDRGAHVAAGNPRVGHVALQAGALVRPHAQSVYAGVRAHGAETIRHAVRRQAQSWTLAAWKRELAESGGDLVHLEGQNRNLGITWLGLYHAWSSVNLRAWTLDTLGVSMVGRQVRSIRVDVMTLGCFRSMLWRSLMIDCVWIRRLVGALMLSSAWIVLAIGDSNGSLSLSITVSSVRVSRSSIISMGVRRQSLSKMSIFCQTRHPRWLQSLTGFPWTIRTSIFSREKSLSSGWFSSRVWLSIDILSVVRISVLIWVRYLSIAR